jgi:hypothetical protein
MTGVHGHDCQRVICYGEVIVDLQSRIHKVKLVRLPRDDVQRKDIICRREHNTFSELLRNDGYASFETGELMKKRIYVQVQFAERTSAIEVDKAASVHEGDFQKSIWSPTCFIRSLNRIPHHIRGLLEPTIAGHVQTRNAETGSEFASHIDDAE